MNNNNYFQRSMNGIITLSDGVSTLSNGVLSNLNSIHSTSANFTSLNSPEIEDHTTDISGNTSRIVLLEGNTGTNNTNVLALQTDVSNNKIQINTNTTDISNNKIQINTNATDISLNIFNINTNSQLLFDLSNNVQLNDAEILALENNPILLSGILPDISTGNILINSGKSITQSGITNNQFQTSTFTNLTILNSLTLPPDILIPSAEHTGQVEYSASAWITQDISTPTINPNEFRQSYFSSIISNGDITMTNPTSTASLKKLIVDDIANFNDIKVADNKSIIIGNGGILANDERLRLTHIATNSYIDYGTNDLFIRNNTLNNILQMKSNNESIFNYDVKINGALTGTTATSWNTRISDLENEFSEHGDYGALVELVNTKANKSSAILNNNVSFQSGETYGFYMDWVTGTHLGTNDYDVRMMLRNQAGGNGLGTVDIFGSINVAQNISGPTITAINTTLGDVDAQIQSMEEYDDFLLTKITTLETYNTKIKSEKYNATFFIEKNSTKSITLWVSQFTNKFSSTPTMAEIRNHPFKITVIFEEGVIGTPPKTSFSMNGWQYYQGEGVSYHTRYIYNDTDKFFNFRIDTDVNMVARFFKAGVGHVTRESGWYHVTIE